MPTRCIESAAILNPLMVAFQYQVRYSVGMNHEYTGYTSLETYTDRALERHARSPHDRVELVHEVMKSLIRSKSLQAIDEAAAVGSPGAYEAVCDAVRPYLADNETLVELAEVVLAQYMETKLYLCEFGEGKLDDRGDLDANEQILAEIYTRIMDGKPECFELTEVDVFSFVATERQHSAEMLEQCGDLEQLRADFVERLTLLADEFEVDEELLTRARYLAQTVEITLLTPLEMMTGTNYTKNTLPECSAVYNGHTHEIMVNTATILWDTNTQKQLDAHMRQILYHELFHSITSTWMSQSEDGASRFVYFPDFIEESLAEKISFRMLDEPEQQVVRRSYREGDTRRNYPRYRHSYMRPRHTMHGTYSGYRYAHDMMMARLDWQAADIDQTTAENLLLSAILDGPSAVDHVDRRSPHLAAFHRALTRASFPGFMRHLYDLYEYEGGEQRVMNCFDAPGFNPHDKGFFERSATSKLYELDYYDSGDNRDTLPDLETLIWMGKLHFKYHYGWRDFVLNESEGDIETYDREYPVVDHPERYVALKSLARTRMDNRASTRQPILRYQYFDK